MSMLTSVQFSPRREKTWGEWIMYRIHCKRTLDTGVKVFELQIMCPYRTILEKDFSEKVTEVKWTKWLFIIISQMVLQTSRTNFPLNDTSRKKPKPYNRFPLISSVLMSIAKEGLGNKVQFCTWTMFYGDSSTSSRCMTSTKVKWEEITSFPPYRKCQLHC